MQNYYLFLSFITFYPKKTPNRRIFFIKSGYPLLFHIPTNAHSTNNSLKVWNFRDFLLHLQTEQFMLPMNRETMTRMIAEYFKTQPVLKAWLFGSFARGEEREDSDVDLLILPDKSQHFSLFTLSGMYEDLKDLLGCEVDLITDGGLMSFARESADRDKILIYERAA